MSIDIKLHKNDIPADIDLSKHKCLAVDSEMAGLNVFRDPLYLVQISSGNSDAHIVQLNRETFDAPNLKKLLTNKDSFIRKRIVDQNLAYLNTRLEGYLGAIGLPHSVVFLNDLSVEIQELGRDLDFDNLSRGERNRLILSLSWAFRDVWESLYQPINLLFIDELVDSGMDSAGVENAMGVLKRMSRERNKSVWLVSHKDELVGRVNNVLKVVKENGFTSYDTDIEIV